MTLDNLIVVLTHFYYYVIMVPGLFVCTILILPDTKLKEKVIIFLSRFGWHVIIALLLLVNAITVLEIIQVDRQGTIMENLK